MGYSLGNLFCSWNTLIFSGGNMAQEHTIVVHHVTLLAGVLFSMVFFFLGSLFGRTFNSWVPLSFKVLPDYGYVLALFGLLGTIILGIARNITSMILFHTWLREGLWSFIWSVLFFAGITFMYSVQLRRNNTCMNLMEEIPRVDKDDKSSTL
jgi:hypothetical protein